MLIGIDLTDFYLSVEWDILEVPAGRNEEYYPCCSEPFAGIVFIIDFTVFKEKCAYIVITSLNVLSLFLRFEKLPEALEFYFEN